jgi:hypothetical protein
LVLAILVDLSRRYCGRKPRSHIDDSTTHSHFNPADHDHAGNALSRTRGFQIEVENSLKGTVPSNWWLHASWRDQTLVVFVSPPTQESFNLWYDTPRQKETLEDLCKAIPVAIWNEIQPDQDILHGRVACTLLELAEKFGQDVGSGRIVIHQKIGQRILPRWSVSRVKLSTAFSATGSAAS